MNARRVGVLAAAVIACFGVIVEADEVLKHKLKKGDKLIYRMKSEMKQTQNLAGMAIDNQFLNDAISSYTVDEIDEKGNYQLSIKAERLKVKMTFGALGGDYAFDSQSSERDTSSMIGAEVTPLFERLSGIVYHAQMSPDGEVLEVRGYAEQLKDIFEAHPLAVQFAGGASNDAAKQGLEELFVKLPDKPCKPGDSWDHSAEIQLAGIGKTRTKSTYRYVGPDKIQGRDTAKLEVTGETSIDLDVDQGGAKVTGTISSTGSTGTVHFDVAAGRVLRIEGNTTLGGDLSIDAGGMIIALRNDQSIAAAVELLEKLPD